MSFEEFLMLLKEWGKWSRGGIPKYRCFLNREYSVKPLINDDVAQELDHVLCMAREKLTPARTQAFELYYKGGWSVSAIAAHRNMTRYDAEGEISGIEKVMYMGWKK